MDIRPAFHRHLQHLVGAWLAILVALYGAIAGLAATGFIAMALLSAGEPDRWSLFGALAFCLALTVIAAIPLALAFSVLAIPFLMLQAWIVDPRPPYLRLGYIAVILYGPALLILIDHGWEPTSWPLLAAYEVTALLATALYLRLAGPFDLFPKFPPEPAT
jgi:hypothetical protein